MPTPCPKCGRLYTWTGTRCCDRECRYGSGLEPIDPTPRLQAQAQRAVEDEARRLSVCWRHRVPLQAGEAPLWYGLIRFDEVYAKASREEFPCSCSFRLGGSYMHSSNPRTCEVKYCPECRKAEASWNDAHPDLAPDPVNSCAAFWM